MLLFRAFIMSNDLLRSFLYDFLLLLDALSTLWHIKYGELDCLFKLVFEFVFLRDLLDE